MKLTMLKAMMIAGLIGLAAVTASAQDFQKSYRLQPGGQVRIGNISGDVIVTGYDGDAINVKATKSGRDGNLIEIEDRSGSSNIDITVRYPRRGNTDGSVTFEVQVPRSVNFDFDHIGSVSGDVQVSNVTGRLHANSVSGDVHINNVSGSVSASSVSGDVKVEIAQLQGADDMKFSTVSGDVTVTLPTNLDADVDLSSFSGTVRTDFPVEVKKERYGMNTTARGKLGEGSRRLKMSSVSGDLALRHP